MKKILFINALVIQMILIGCNTKGKDAVGSEENAGVKNGAEKDMTLIKAEIESLEMAWADAQNTKNSEALLAMYTDDAMILPPNAPMITGSAAIKAQIERDFAENKPGTIEFATLGVFGNENEVTEVGTAIRKDASGTVIYSGKYMAVFKKVDGKYLCHREIYNSDK